MKPYVSIIVPVYKVPEQYLKKCIDSLTDQTLQEIEIILVDDGSPDRCGAICDTYAQQDHRIKVLHKTNGGLSAARNSGFFAATGDWIMFVDGDDWIEPETCEQMYAATKKNSSIQLVMCGVCKDYAGKIVPYKHHVEPDKVYLDKECKILQERVLEFNGNIAMAYAKLINRKLLMDNHILHDEQLRQGAEGIEFNLRLFGQITGAVFIDRVFYHYIFNDQSISVAHNEKNHQYVIHCFEKIYEEIQNSPNTINLLPWFYNRMLYVIITTAISGYFSFTNKEPFAVKKKKYEQYLQNPVIQDALRVSMIKDLSKQRQLILFLIKRKQYRIISFIGYLRYKQKTGGRKRR